MDNVKAQGEGWIMAQSVVVTPNDAQPGDTVHIKAVFKNTAAYLPGYGVPVLELDGLWIYGGWASSAVFVLAGLEFLVEIDYVLPSSISTGTWHRVEAREADQRANIPGYDFTVSSPAPPGQRNVSFSSVPADAQIYVSEVYRGNTPLTISLAAGTYAVRAVYAGQEQRKNIQVSLGSGSMSVPFTFAQDVPFDLGKWVSDNKWYLGATVVGIGILYLAVKRPATLQRGASKAYELAGKGYEKAKEVYQKSMLKD